MTMNELTTVNQEKIGQNFTDENGVEWIWEEEYHQHAMKYQYDEELNEWSKLNEENMTYEPLVWVHQPKPTAAMGKYGSMRLKFIWKTPHLIEAIMLNEELEVEQEKLNRHCEEMNERVLNLIDEITEKKKQSEEYKETMKSGKYIPMVQLLESYKAEAEEEILPVTVYAI